jgi:hypothetical protein
MQLWVTPSTSNIDILERFQSKALSMTVDAPWYIPNTVIRRDLQIPTVKEEIRRYSSQYSVRLSTIQFFVFLFFVNPLLFASCTNTFSKWCKITRGKKRSAQ